jgi:hypothetical protein
VRQTEDEVRPTVLWRIEVVAAIVGGLLGTVLGGYGLLSMSDFFRAGGGYESALLITVAASALLAGAGYLDCRYHGEIGASIWLTLVWVGALFLTYTTVVSFGNINWYLLPGALVGLVAAVAGSLAQIVATRSHPSSG